ncbi:hypothetical protein Acr_03g0012760 [Actinidia rufa]|uniref:Uncharacterized protein n=1 Tax=Actinidia rufa TaxID=165716 RepID=A0A7J0EDT4_9ERIC|nr:hypothetical protein Acr_03g0012760 [Actinidia rufa]
MKRNDDSNMSFTSFHIYFIATELGCSWLASSASAASGGILCGFFFPSSFCSLFHLFFFFSCTTRLRRRLSSVCHCPFAFSNIPLGSDLSDLSIVANWWPKDIATCSIGFDHGSIRVFLDRHYCGFYVVDILRHLACLGDYCLCTTFCNLLQPPRASCSLLELPAISCSLLELPVVSWSFLQPLAASCCLAQPATSHSLCHRYFEAFANLSSSLFRLSFNPLLSS